MQGPDVAILDALVDAYLPVPFDHKGHAEMAQMTEGCSTCHHLSPEGERPPPCRSCHDIFSAGTDIHKPGLKGAYHQQCMNCHRDWMDETDCGICHVARTGRMAISRTTTLSSGDDLTGRSHPPIPEPTSEFYRGAEDENADSRVVFRHAEHVDRFGLTCVECHHERSCNRCHTALAGQQRQRSVYEHHRVCLSCHKTDMDGASKTARCDRCHWTEGDPPIERFSHASTGWPLNRYHKDLSCRQCHFTVPFVRRESDCTACHYAWGPSTFDHSVTGQLLDENHVEQDCEECHVDRKYDAPPACDSCHDEDDDGIAFPAKRPGRFINVNSSRASTRPGSR